jgi:hypothetical protein
MKERLLMTAACHGPTVPPSRGVAAASPAHHHGPIAKEETSMQPMIDRWLRAGVLSSLILALTLAFPDPALRAAASVESAPTSTPGTFAFLARGFDDGEEVSTWVTGTRQQVQASGL